MFVGNKELLLLVAQSQATTIKEWELLTNRKQVPMFVGNKYIYCSWCNHEQLLLKEGKILTNSNQIPLFVGNIYCLPARGITTSNSYWWMRNHPRTWNKFPSSWMTYMSPARGKTTSIFYGSRWKNPQAGNNPCCSWEPILLPARGSPMSRGLKHLPKTNFSRKVGKIHKKNPKFWGKSRKRGNNCQIIFQEGLRN